MPNEDNKTLEHNHGENSLKLPFIIEYDTQKKHLFFKIILKILRRKKKSKHETPGCTLYLTCSFDATENKHDYSKGEESIEWLCKQFKDYVI